MSWYKTARRAEEKGITKKDVNAKELKDGIKVEQEHTSDKKEAEKIALDHLAEIPNYYSMLHFMEKAGEEAMDDNLPSGLCPYAYKFSKFFIEKTKDNWNYITPEDLNKKGLDKFFILDIRKPGDFKKGHLKGATNIFWMDVFKPENLKKLPSNKKILVYCYVGHTSSQVLVLLSLLGFDVVSLKYGMGISPVEGVPVAGWTNFGFETVNGK